MHTLIVVSIAFVAVLGFILFPVMRWKWHSADAPLFAVSLIMALLYIFGLFNAFPFGVYFIFALSILLSILAVFLARKELKQAITRLFSPAFILFLLMFVLLGYLARSWTFQEWDEFSHWGMFVKAMFFENKLPPLVSFSMVMNRYPPVISIFWYYITKLAGYSEQGVYFAQNIIILSAFVAVLKGITWKKSFLAVGVILFGYMSMYLWGFKLNSIYMDGVLGVIFGATLMAYYGDEKRDWRSILKIAPTLFILPVVKQLGIFFALVIAGFILFDQLVLKTEQGFELKTVFSRKFALRLLAYSPVVWVPMLSYFSWGYFLKYWHIDNPSYVPSLNFLNVLKAFSILATDNQRATINRFLLAYHDTLIGFSTLGCIGIITAFIILILVYILIKPRKEGMRRSIWLQVVLLGGFLLYSFTMMLFFVFDTDTISAAVLHSYSRYMGTYILGWSYAVFVLFYLEIKDNLFNGWFDQKLFFTVYLSLILATIYFVPVANLLTPPVEITQRRDVLNAVTPFIPIMEENSRVYLIYQGTDGFFFHITRYFIAPRTTNSWSWSLGEPYVVENMYGGDVWTVNMSPEEWFNKVQNEKYDYIYVGFADEKFWERYGDLFIGESNDNPQLFKVEPDRFVRVLP